MNRVQRFFGAEERPAGPESARDQALRRLVREVIRSEDPFRPLCDADVALVLHARGVDVARRTVTKHRKRLGIAPSIRRRPA